MSDLFSPLPGGLGQAWATASHGERLRQLRKAALTTREQLLATGPVRACATVKLITFPYPTQYAFCGGALSPAPFVMMTNRMQIVQFEHQGKTRTLLFNPSDVERDRAATFYSKLAAKMPQFLDKMLPRFGTVPEHLARLGLSPNDIDYLAYDHLHVQDLRGWLGGEGIAPFFPRAKLLVMKQEWDEVNDLHPMNRVWYVPGGAEVPGDRVEFLHGDTLLGPGVAIVSTPGHTLGNMSLAVVTPEGPFVVSENGVAAESYTPERSAIPGVRAWAQRMEAEVVLNGNTREGSLDQYSSMIVEKLIAGPVRGSPDFVAFAPSSELTASMIAPGLSPTFSFTPPDVGTLAAR